MRRLLVMLLLCSTITGVQAQTAAKRDATKSQRPNAAERAKPAADLPIGQFAARPLPAWVRPAPLVLVPGPASAGGLGYRYLLAQTQVQLGAPGERTFNRGRLLATESSGVEAVSKVEMAFNPAFQSLAVHELAVYRDGRRLDRLKETSLELLRREEQLEKSTLTGVATVLAVIKDVRVGDVVEYGYTITGANPIFKGRFSQEFSLSSTIAIDLVQIRIEHPQTVALRARGIGTDVTPEISTEEGRRVMSVTRRDVAAIVAESSVPKMHKVFPSLHVSDFASWTEVDAWARDLFAVEPQLGAELEARVAAWRAAGLSREALLSEALALVQDEVRYFSVSLGESSHRPKPPAVTWSERLGDCKDKVMLLNALLRQLGFDPKAALVSLHRGPAVTRYLPGFDQFDHVITMIDVDGSTYWLDPTMTRQGRRLATRGFFDYGSAYVVGSGAEAPIAVRAPAGLQESYAVEQRWDVTQPERTRLTLELRTQGQMAEVIRNAIATVGAERVGEAYLSEYLRAFPHLKVTQAAAARDDLDSNTLTLSVSLEGDGLGEYSNGTLAYEFPAIDILGVLSTPQESRRTQPYAIDELRRVRQRIVVKSARPHGLKPQSTNDIGDRHFRVRNRIETPSTTEVTLQFDYERLADQVAVNEIAAFRESIQRARGSAGLRLRVPLFDRDAMRPRFAEIERRITREYGRQSDALTELILRSEAVRALATEALRAAPPQSTLATKILYERADASLGLADLESVLKDVDLARVRKEVSPGSWQYLRGFALIGLGRSEEAIKELQHDEPAEDPWGLRKALGHAQYYAGRHADAAATFRAVAEGANGDEAVFAAIWLYLSAERNGGQGRAAAAGYAERASPEQWPGALLHFLLGKVSEDQLMKLARADEKMLRLNLAEAYFFIAKAHMLKGQRQQAERMFRRTLDIKALPYREHLWANLELRQVAR